MRPLLILAGLFAVAVGQACGGFGSSTVRFMGQTNLIVWDDREGIEHFVRNAQFSTKGKDLGFIAPTPTEPELGEVSKTLFLTLELMNPNQALLTLGGGGFGGGTGKGVQVLQEKTVGGYRASVLRSDNGQALMSWLKDNGYGVSATMKPWLDFYIRKRWCFTAFKVDKKAESDTVSTGPVRLSFRTNRPYNPYYVPADNIPKEPGPEDRLSLYFIARGRFVAQIGATGPWQGQKSWSYALTQRDGQSLAGILELPETAIPGGCTLTKYVDPMFPRPARDDIFFDRVFP